MVFCLYPTFLNWLKAVYIGRQTINPFFNYIFTLFHEKSHRNFLFSYRCFLSHGSHYPGCQLLRFPSLSQAAETPASPRCYLLPADSFTLLLTDTPAARRSPIWLPILLSFFKQQLKPPTTPPLFLYLAYGALHDINLSVILSTPKIFAWLFSWIWLGLRSHKCLYSS